MAARRASMWPVVMLLRSGAARRGPNAQARRRIGSKVFTEMHERGLVGDVFPQASIEFRHLLESRAQTLYCGFDPTADSLHLGHLVPVMALLNWQRSGHHVIALVGDATARIGDPSGRTTCRDAVPCDVTKERASALRAGLERLFRNHVLFLWDGGLEKLGSMTMLNNSEWYDDLAVVDFLSGAGRRFRMGTLLGRHSVQRRLHSADGLSLSEFTYQAFQAYDFLQLYERYGCVIQLGGSDQLGNIMNGHDLISRMHDDHVYGITMPLITNVTGDKLGKTAGNAVWLNRDRTSPFDLYQYLLRLPDNDVERYLRLLTFLPLAEINSIMNGHRKQPEIRNAQRRLAREVTLLVHGKEGLESAKRCTSTLYEGNLEALNAMSDQELREVFQGAPFYEFLLEPGTSILDACHRINAVPEGRRGFELIVAGAVSINHERQNNPSQLLIRGRHVLQNGVLQC
uniref:Tyrosine--tRNA ligase n=1 Tax=Eptatretus burgeri TaxID=7764 RepID=A0A8C4Q5I5_EPTBU